MEKKHTTNNNTHTNNNVVRNWLYFDLLVCSNITFVVKLLICLDPVSVSLFTRNRLPNNLNAAFPHLSPKW